MPGLNAAVCALTLGSLAQTLWLWWRSRNIPEDHSFE